MIEVDFQREEQQGKTLLRLAYELGLEEIAKIFIEYILLKNPEESKPEFIKQDLNLSTFWDKIHVSFDGYEYIDQQKQPDLPNSEKEKNSGGLFSSFWRIFSTLFQFLFRSSIEDAKKIEINAQPSLSNNSMLGHEVTDLQPPGNNSGLIPADTCSALPSVSGTHKYHDVSNRYQSGIFHNQKDIKELNKESEEYTRCKRLSE